MGRSAGGCIVTFLVLGLASGCAPDATTSPPATPVVHDGDSSSTPSGTESAGPLMTLVDARGEAGKNVRVTVIDQSGRLTAAQGAGLRDIAAHRPGFARRVRMIGRNVGESSVIVLWLGSPCDTSGSLIIGPGVGSIAYLPDPRPGCDAINILRGVVLSFDREVAASEIVLSVGPEEIIAE